VARRFGRHLRGRTIHGRKFLAALIAATMVSAAGMRIAAAATGGAVVTEPSSVTMTDQVLVHWSAAGVGVPLLQSQRTAELRSAGYPTLAFVRVTGSGSEVYRLPHSLGAEADQILAALRAMPGVASVEPDLWMRPADLPNDPRAADLWGLLGPADGSPYGVNALGVWPTTTGAGVVVAVIDTGLLFNHPDLAGQSVPGYDLISNPATARDGDGRDPNAADPGDWSTSSDFCGAGTSSWHGTHVAGTIAALAGNGVGVFGGAPGVKVQPVRVLGRCGGTLSDVADGILWAAGASVPGLPLNPYAASVRALNLSLGGSGACGSDLASAISFARSQGKVVAVAAGNSGADAGGFAPGNCPGAFTVAATDSSGKRAWFSDFGSATSPVVDIAAPGVNILSTLNNGTKGPSSYTYAYYNGTSMATPHVSLSAALVAAADPSLTTDQVESILTSTVTPFPPDGTSHSCSSNLTHCGTGIVNAAAAVAAAVPPPKVPDAPTGVTATAGNAAAAVDWTAPASDGGSEITGYTVTSDPDGLTCTTNGTRSCTVSGLTNTTPYTFTVVATNAIGTGPASDPSLPVTPTDVEPAADTDPPVVQAPVATIGSPQALARPVTLNVAWQAASDASGIAEYELMSSVNSGPWTDVTLASPTDLSADVALNIGASIRLRLAARDGMGNWSDWIASAPVSSTPALVQENSKPPMGYSGSFKRVLQTGASGGYVKKSAAAGHRATLAFSGTAAALVSTLGPNRGIASISVDGGPAVMVDLYAASLNPARIVWTSAALTAGAHTVVVTVPGTRNVAATKARVDIDAFMTF
jgi:serine protease